jgi:hypothetical protein
MNINIHTHTHTHTCEDLPIPPIFNHSTEILTNKDERIARDAYWRCVYVCVCVWIPILLRIW